MTDHAKHAVLPALIVELIRGRGTDELIHAVAHGLDLTEVAATAGAVLDLDPRAIVVPTDAVGSELLARHGDDPDAVLIAVRHLIQSSSSWCLTHNEADALAQRLLCTYIRDQS